MISLEANTITGKIDIFFITSPEKELSPKGNYIYSLLNPLFTVNLSSDTM
jgi:hypothetical protein